jgi:uncharacterized membrane protein
MLCTSLISLPVFGVISFSENKVLTFQAFKVPVFTFTCCVIVTAYWYLGLIVVTFWGSRLYYKRRFNKDYPTFKSE